ncbi:MAG: tRNA glutamyl-Q(34) synthetase GluQRS [Pseudomonadota bacterium]|nr:tRNA glutamyl-Q(34) synthetase GluQRS [Pseudomonadota bacterium]
MRSLGQHDRHRDRDQDRYRGRFAPSPTGPLHAGSLVAALASWLDARAHGGQWLLRIEDVDKSRCSVAAARWIEQQLADCGLHSDAPPQVQSGRGGLYRSALDALISNGLAYPCSCTRKDIERYWADHDLQRAAGADLPYPGTCRAGLRGRVPRAWRLRLPDGAGAHVRWIDRRLGHQSQDVGTAVGDFVLRRADGVWAYQLAVVVDDAEQTISDVVRGEDLVDNTARQILLQRALGLPTPRYLHTPVVLAADGRKLSKQNGAEPVDTVDAVASLQQAGLVLGLPLQPAPDTLSWLKKAVPAWAGIIESFTAQEPE